MLFNRSPQASRRAVRAPLLILAGLLFAVAAAPTPTQAATTASAAWPTIAPFSQDSSTGDALTALLAARKAHLAYPYWAEAKAKSYQGEKGADGTYKKSGEFIAAMFGITIDYNYKDIYLHCAGTNLSEENTFAAYCSSALSKIYVNSNISGFDYMARSLYYPSAIKHEMAHYLIGKICAASGSTSPPIAGSKTEAVTSSFAVLFLGADRAELNNVGEASYWMTAGTDQIATEIHDDFQCK